MSPGRTTGACLGLLLLLTGCGDAAAGLPDPVDLSAASAAAAASGLAAASGSAAAPVASDPEVVPEDVSAAAGSVERPPAARPTPVAGAPGGAATSNRTADRVGSANARAGTPAAVPRAGLPTPKVVQPPPPVEPAQTPRPFVEPTRTPAPLLIDPVDAYGGSLKQFTGIVEGRAVEGRCGEAGRPKCLRVVPHRVGDQSFPLIPGCQVKASRPPLQPDPDDRAKKLTLPGDGVPLTVDTDVDCSKNLEPDESGTT